MKQQGPQMPQPTTKSSQPEWMNLLLFLTVSLLILYWFNVLTAPEIKVLPYSEFKQEVQQDRVAKVSLRGDELTGEFKAPAGGGKAGGDKQAQPETTGRFKTVLPSMADPELLPLLEKNNVIIKAESTSVSWWLQLLAGIVPWLLIFGFFYFISRRMQERLAGGPGIFGVGKSKARLYSEADTRLTFDDVAGLENAKADLRDIIAFLREPGRFRDLGAVPPRGMLMMGPPGTGKTLLARATAGEAQVPFFSISGSEFVEMFVGVGAARVRDLFENAKKSAPAIIFIDEIDAVGRSRGIGLGGGNDEREQTLNQILSLMDGFSPEESVVVMAATNRPDVLDPALLRPGRFDRKLVLQLPDRKAREDIIKIHAGHIRHSDNIDWNALARRTAGFSGADLKNLINEAALLAGREEKKEVDTETLELARDKIVLGTERTLLLNEEQKKIVAYHEAGHTLAAWLMPHADPPEKVTIIPRGRALGVTEQMPRDDQYSLQESYLKDRLVVMLAGRSSEELVFGETSSGAESDIEQATRLARKMVSSWGMNSKLGAANFSTEEDQVFLGKEIAQPRNFSEHTAQLIDDEIRELLSRQQEISGRVLKANRQYLDSLAQALLNEETLGREAIKAVLQEAKMPESVAAAA
ncbi:MAG: ATP-dependent zinc metalloprotease FtsH [Desulfobulbaceae bacterium]|nr:ATP-dependent zinc metalloprotease FtsH [Desulfobulbaceae bacterium]